MPGASESHAVQERPDQAPVPTLRAPYLIIDDFLPLELAQAMRKDIEEHFGTPYKHRPETHQVWNYWHVPQMYNYLRTNPEKVIAHERVEALMSALRGWAIETLGMAEVHRPYVSLYVAGCSQGLHNDAANGRFAYVYSLTPNERRTSGGETIIFKEGDPFRNNMGGPAAGTSFYVAVPPRFNRLVLFDDRMPHAVERVDGSMDPVQGRIVLHGHIRDRGPIVAGALPAQPVLEVVSDALHRFNAVQAAGRVGVLKGPLVVRLRIAPSGQVARTELLVDRVTQMDPRFPEPKALVAKLTTMLSGLAFAAADGETAVTLPIVLGEDPQARA